MYQKRRIHTNCEISKHAEIRRIYDKLLFTSNDTHPIS